MNTAEPPLPQAVVAANKDLACRHVLLRCLDDFAIGMLAEVVNATLVLVKTGVLPLRKESIDSQGKAATTPKAALTGQFHRQEQEIGEPVGSHQRAVEYGTRPLRQGRRRRLIPLAGPAPVRR